MTSIYFAKLNINNEIYEVYDKKVEIKKLRSDIFNAINNSVILDKGDKGQYKFSDIDYSDDGLKLVSKLGHIKPGVHSTYDPEEDTAIDKADPNKIEYVVFYLDLDKELIGYTTNNSIRKEKFIRVFQELIAESTGLGIDLELVNNKEKFEDKFRDINILKKVIVTMVPPNDDEEDFEALFGAVSNLAKDARVTSAKQEYSTRRKDGLVKASKLVQLIKHGSYMGYAEAKFTGKDSSGRNLTVTTKETPWKAEINNNDAHNNSEVKDVSEKIFEKIGTQITKSRLKLREKK